MLFSGARGFVSRALGCRERRKAACTQWRTFGSRAGSVARGLGVHSRKIWQVIAGSLSAELEPSKLVENPYISKSGNSLLYLYLQQLHDSGTAHTACFRLSGCARSSFLRGKPCVMGMKMWNPLKDTGAISTAACNIVRRYFVFQRKGCCCSSQSTHISAAAVRLGHGPYTRLIPLYSSHQTRPRMPASICLAALEVSPVVVGLKACVLWA